MKIAIHAPRAAYYYGGAERYILNLTLELEKSNNNISLITYDSPIKTNWFKEFKKKFKGKIILLKSKELDNNFYKFKNATTPALWDLESKLFSKISYSYYEKENFDIISLHYTFDCFGIPSNQKICLHLHGSPKKIRDIDKIALKIPNKIIVVSNYVFEGWKKSIPFNKKVIIIPNGIGNLKIKGFKKSTDILFFGRLIKTKGADILIKSVFLLKKLFPTVFLKIIGDGPEKLKLEKLVNKLHLQNNVSFLGKVSDFQLYKMIEQSRISVFPSYAKEGIMTTLLEAAKLKSTILASDSCSNREFISNKKEGILFKAKDINNLTEHLKKLLFDEKLRNSLVKKAYKKVNNFSWKNQTKKILTVYKK